MQCTAGKIITQLWMLCKYLLWNWNTLARADGKQPDNSVDFTGASTPDCHHALSSDGHLLAFCEQ